MMSNLGPISADALPGADEIARAIATLHPDGGIIELRAMHKGGRKRVDAGYFDVGHRDQLVAEAVRLNKLGASVYVTMNPIDPQLQDFPLGDHPVS